MIKPQRDRRPGERWCDPHRGTHRDQPGAQSCAFGAGAIAGALLTGPVARRVPFARIFWLGLVLSGTGLVAFSRSTQLQAAIGILCLCGVTRRMVNTVITPLLWERHRSTFSAGSAP